MAYTYHYQDKTPRTNDKRMNRLLLILASVAVAGGFLTSALVLAHAQDPGRPAYRGEEEGTDAMERAVAGT